MAQWVKCWLHKRKDLNSNPQTGVKARLDDPSKRRELEENAPPQLQGTDDTNTLFTFIHPYDLH